MPRSGVAGGALIKNVASVLRSRDPQDGWLSFVFTIPDSKEKLDEKWDGTIAAFLSAIDVT